MELHTMPDAISFISIVLIATFTPGPNNILSMSNASRYGFKNSFPFNMGVFVGFAVIMVLCTAFSSTLSAVIPGIKPYMQVVGAIYILWLAWKVYHTVPGEVVEQAGTNTFRSGMLLQFVNPKVILYGITVISTFVVPYYRSVPILLGFSILLAAVGFIATCCWAVFGALFQKFLIRYSKTVNIVMALLLVYCAMSLFVT
jgi:cysteine/O-acetylserine efflux protein